eukprot:gene16640-biopygen18806
MRPECVLDTPTDGFEGPPLKPPLVGSTWCPPKMVFWVRPAAYISSHACVKRGFCGQVVADVPRGWEGYSVLLGISVLRTLLCSDNMHSARHTTRSRSEMPRCD